MSTSTIQLPAPAAPADLVLVDRLAHKGWLIDLVRRPNGRHTAMLRRPAGMVETLGVAYLNPILALDDARATIDRLIADGGSR